MKIGGWAAENRAFAVVEDARPADGEAGLRAGLWVGFGPGGCGSRRLRPGGRFLGLSID